MKKLSNRTSDRRDRMIRETEADLNRQLNRRPKGHDVQWPRRTSPRQRGTVRRAISTAGEGSRGGSPDRAPLSVHRPCVAATLVKIRGNEQGYLDDECSGALIDPLLILASDQHGGTLVVDLSAICSFRAPFLTLLAALRKTLSRRKRRLALCGVRSQGAALLRGSGLDETIDIHATWEEALTATDRKA